MSYAHKVIVVRNRDELNDNELADKELPLLIDNNKISEGSNAIFRYLEELKGFKELWDKFQSDACYCSEQGDIE